MGVAVAAVALPPATRTSLVSAVRRVPPASGSSSGLGCSCAFGSCIPPAGVLRVSGRGGLPHLREHRALQEPLPACGRASLRRGDPAPRPGPLVHRARPSRPGRRNGAAPLPGRPPCGRPAMGGVGACRGGPPVGHAALPGALGALRTAVHVPRRRVRVLRRAGRGRRWRLDPGGWCAVRTLGRGQAGGGLPDSGCGHLGRTSSRHRSSSGISAGGVGPCRRRSRAGRLSGGSRRT